MLQKKMMVQKNGIEHGAHMKSMSKGIWLFGSNPTHWGLCPLQGAGTQPACVKPRSELLSEEQGPRCCSRRRPTSVSSGQLLKPSSQLLGPGYSMSNLPETEGLVKGRSNCLGTGSLSSGEDQARNPV